MNYEGAWDELRLTLEEFAALRELVRVERVLEWMKDLEDLYE